MIDLLLQLSAVIVVFNGLSSAVALQADQPICPGAVKTVKTAEDLFLPGIKKKLEKEHDIKVTIRNDSEIPPSITSLNSSLDINFKGTNFSENPIKFNITGNYGKSDCYLGDFVANGESSIYFDITKIDRAVHLQLSTIDSPYKRIVNKGRLTINMASNPHGLASVIISPAAEFVNEGVLKFKDFTPGGNPASDSDIINSVNKLETLKSVGDTITNSGFIDLEGTSLTINNNFKKYHGFITLNKSQLVLLLDKYDGSNPQILWKQRIYLEAYSAIYFGRNVYSSPKAVFAGEVDGLDRTNALIFEDKIESLKYDKDNSSLIVKIKMPNGVRELRIDGTILFFEKLKIYDAPTSSGRFTNGSMIVVELDEDDDSY